MKKVDTKYLIMGNGVAAIASIEGIRSADKTGLITLIAKEPEHTYSRPLISYLLGGEVNEDRMYYRPPDFYDKNMVRAILGSEVAQIKDKEKTVITADGDGIKYEKLLIATGGVPIMPDLPGAKNQGVFTFISWKDAKNIRDFIAKRNVKKAVVVGAGLIGLKTMEALLALNIEVDMVELADRILGATFDSVASALMQRRLEEEGVRIHCNTTVKEIKATGGAASGVRLKHNAEIDCDIIIFAIGVRPNIGIVEGTGVNTERGILVNEYMETSVPEIYAAGDCTQGYDVLLKTTRPIAIFPNAYRQGRVAGTNMAGGREVYAGGLAMNSVSVCGIPTISVGVTEISVGVTEAPDEDCETLTRVDEKSYIYKKIVLKANKIIGAIFINDVDRAGIYTGLIRSGIDVSQVKELLLTDDFGLLMLPTEYRKYIVSGVAIEV